MQSESNLRDILEAVLAEPRFEAPRESFWDRLVSRVLAEIGRIIAAAIDAVGGPLVAALIALTIVAVVVVAVSIRLAGRRAATISERLELVRLLETGADPAEFLRRAAQASEAGDHATAIRLRFVGGVLDLGRRGRIDYAPGLTTGGIVDQVADPDFSRLADQFDAIAYGGHPASASDDRWSIEMWDSLRSPR